MRVLSGRAAAAQVQKIAARSAQFERSSRRCGRSWRTFAATATGLCGDYARALGWAGAKQSFRD